MTKKEQIDAMIQIIEYEDEMLRRSVGGFGLTEEKIMNIATLAVQIFLDNNSMITRTECVAMAKKQIKEEKEREFAEIEKRNIQDMGIYLHDAKVLLNIALDSDSKKEIKEYAVKSWILSNKIRSVIRGYNSNDAINMKNKLKEIERTAEEISPRAIENLIVHWTPNKYQF